MIIAFLFFDSRGIVHKEFVPPEQTVNHAFYKDVLEQFRKRVQQVRTDIADDWVLHHDNAPAHTALSIREFLAKKNIPILPHPPYSPDSAPCDFYLFLKLKSKLKGHHFGTMENIKKLKPMSYTHLRKMTCGTAIIIIISNLSNDRSKASSKTIPPHSAI